MTLSYWLGSGAADQVAVVARYTFKPEYAADFSAEGNQIVEIAFETVQEAKEFASEFENSLIDVSVIFEGVVINLSDYRYES
tara:strand:+ start:567 stop:812 length:246 start_codon:yes stop_codon:yes gene_type:complete